MAARLYVHRARPLRRNPAAWLSGSILVLLAGLVLAAPLSGANPLATAPADQLRPPSLAHPLGTDLLGRDVWSRLLWGGRLSLAAGLLAVGLVALPGTLLGMLAGYAGGWPDRLLMRIVDVLLAFPSLLLTLTIIALLGTGLLSAAVAVGLAGVARFARLVRAAVLGVQSQPYIQAARVVGCRPGRILWRHVLPNASGTLIVLSSLELGYALLNISALGFLGLGAQPPAPEWGTMLADGRGLLRDAPWAAGAPGLAITLSVLAVNLLGDAWREALDAGGR